MCKHTHGKCHPSNPGHNSGACLPRHTASHTARVRNPHNIIQWLTDSKVRCAIPQTRAPEDDTYIMRTKWCIHDPLQSQTTAPSQGSLAPGTGTLKPRLQTGAGAEKSTDTREIINRYCKLGINRSVPRCVDAIVAPSCTDTEHQSKNIESRG